MHAVRQDVLADRLIDDFAADRRFGTPPGPAAAPALLPPSSVGRLRGNPGHVRRDVGAHGGAATWGAIIGSVASAFTRPLFAIFVDLAAGWVLTPGRRTITRIIGVIDPEGRRAHDAPTSTDRPTASTQKTRQAPYACVGYGTVTYAFPG